MHVVYQTEQERLWVEQAIAFFAEMRDSVNKAPACRLIDGCEGYAVDVGQKLLRHTLRSAVQACGGEVEEKWATPASAGTPDATASKGGMAGS